MKNKLKMTMKSFICLLYLALFGFSANAQKDNNQISAGLEIGLPIGDFSEVYGLGIGVNAKGLYGIGEAGQISLTTGYTRFGLKDSEDGLKGSFGIIPLFVGYRHNFDGFYVEPQIGLSINRTKLKFEGGDFGGFGGFSGSSSDTSLGYAAAVGYIYNQFDASIRYQGLSLEGTNLSLIGIRLAYNFSF